MPDLMLPVGSGLPVYPSGETAASSVPALVTAGVANTKGSWTAINAFTWDRAASGLWLTYRPVAANTVVLMDLGYSFDNGTNYEVVVPNIMMNGSASTFRHSYFPIYMPPGVRLGVRIQSATASTTARVMAHLQPPAPGWVTGCSYPAVNWGANTATSRGTAVDPGAAANTKGSYVTFAALTVVRRVRWMHLMVHLGGNAAPTAANWLIDVSFGKGGTDNEVLKDIPYVCSTTAGGTSPDIYGPFPVNIPHDANIRIRAQCSITDATDRLLDCGVLVYH